MTKILNQILGGVAFIFKEKHMKKSFFKKRSFVAIVLIAIFSFTGLVYAKKANKVMNAEKTKSAEIQSTASANVVIQPEDQVVAQSPEDAQSLAQAAIQPESEESQNAPSEKSQVKDESTLSQKPESFVASVSKAIVHQADASTTASTEYPIHTNIATTFFWAGEEAGADNKNISNLPSAWDEEWVSHFGGIDKPNKRSGYMPAGFTPRENPFYFALPYNDFDENGDRKKEVNKIVPWAGQVAWKSNESALKNQWIKVTKNGKVAYAQWEDVGPFKEDDAAYVFGNAQPQSKINNHAGLDVSPAVHDLLGLSDIDTVDWQFVRADQVPDGPWKIMMTRSQINWK